MPLVNISEAGTRHYLGIIDMLEGICLEEVDALCINFDPGTDDGSAGWDVTVIHHPTLYECGTSHLYCSAPVLEFHNSKTDISSLLKKDQLHSENRHRAF